MSDNDVYELEVAYARRFQSDAGDFRGLTESLEAYGARVQASLHSGTPMQHITAEKGSVL